MVLGDDFRDRHDMRTVTLRICGQQPQNAGARPLRMHQPVSMLDSLQRMACQRIVNPLFYFTGHGQTLSRPSPRHRGRIQFCGTFDRRPRGANLGTHMIRVTYRQNEA